MNLREVNFEDSKFSHHITETFKLLFQAYSKEGNKIDLSSLRKSNGHWTLRDPRVNKTHLIYHINVCGPLARNLPNACHGKCARINIT